MSSYKDFASNEIVSTKTLLYEAIPITGTIVSGTYSDLNIKTYSHGLFTSVYDYPFLSSSANHLFDITVGYSTGSAASASAVTASNTAISKKKTNLYYQMSQVLAGYDTTGSILLLDEDGNFNNTGDLIHNAFFLNFSRLLAKDEIQKGSFTITLGAGPNTSSAFSSTILIKDVSGSTSYKINSPVGEYGILYVSQIDSTAVVNTNPACGMIFYQAGVVVLNTNVFAISSSNSPQADIASNQRGILITGSAPQIIGTSNVAQVLASGSINDFGNAVRSRIKNITFNNTTEVNSSIFFCKIPSTDFNYSSNDTYLSGSKMVVKSKKEDQPVAYFTTVGLYSKSNELLAVAKLSEPIKKDPSTDLTIRVRLDF